MAKRRRLAFVIHDLNSWGGHDRSTLEIARRLSHRWPVDICAFTLEDPAGMGAWGDVRFFRIRPNIKHPVLAKFTFFYGASVPALRVLPRLRGEPAPLVHATGSCSLVSDVVQVQFVSAAWKQIRDRLDPELCRAPRARTAGGLSGRAIEAYHEFMLDYNAAVEHRVYTRDKTYIAIARGVADELAQLFGIRENVHVIHHGVDSGQFRPAEGGAGRADLRRELGVREHEVLVSFVGVYERKGLAVAIDALGRLEPGLRSRVKLMAVGQGGVAAFEARAARLGVADRVLFVNHTREIVPYYQAADAFLLPTLYEPFGLVILEAMACGLPAAVSRLAGGAELIRDGENGLLIQDPTDAVEVARVLERLVADPLARTRMGAGARATAVARSWDRVADEYAAVLGPLLEGPPRKGRGRDE